MRTITLSAGLFILALLVGALGYSAYAYQYAYTQQTTLLQRLQFGLLNAPQWRYGTIIAIDADNATLQLQFASGASIRATLAPDAYIGRQDLITEGGMYVGALAPVRSTLADLAVGQHIAASILRDDQGKFVLPIVLFGDPI